MEKIIFLQHRNHWTRFLAISSLGFSFHIDWKLSSTQKFLKGSNKGKSEGLAMDCKEVVGVVPYQTDRWFPLFLVMSEALHCPGETQATL